MGTGLRETPGVNMQRFKITAIKSTRGIPYVYVDGEMSGERWCEVLGGIGVDREKRARIVLNALHVYQNYVYPKTTPGSKTVAGFPQMELHFPEE